MYFLTRSSLCSSSGLAGGSPSFKISMVWRGLNFTLDRRLTWRSNALEVSLGEYCDNFLQKSYSIQLGTFLFSHIWNCKNQVYTNLRGEKVLLDSWKNKIALNMAHNDWLRDNISTSHGATLQFSFLLCLLQISQKLLPFPLLLLSNKLFGIQLDRRFKNYSSK